jgi:FtsZ-interacting cell division protein ZipA
MPELRWALLGLGLLFLAGLALWEWRRSRRRLAGGGQNESGGTNSEPAERADRAERPRRIEPSIDGMTAPASDGVADSLEMPAIHPMEPVLVTVAAQSAVDVPAAARFAAPVAPVSIQWPPQQTSQVLSLRVVHERGEPLPGRQLRSALAAAGLVHGPQNIFHRVDAAGAVLVSAANLVRPGNLDPELMDLQEFRGISLFSVLPGPLPPVRMLEELVAVARGLAHRLSATVQDEHGADLDGVRLTQLRRSLPDVASSAGDGTTP